MLTMIATAMFCTLISCHMHMLVYAAHKPEYAKIHVVDCCSS